MGQLDGGGRLLPCHCTQQRRLIAHHTHEYSAAAPTRRHVFHHADAKVLVHHGVQPRHRIPQQRAQLIKRNIGPELDLRGTAGTAHRQDRRHGRVVGHGAASERE